LWWANKIPNKNAIGVKKRDTLPAIPIWSKHRFAILSAMSVPWRAGFLLPATLATQTFLAWEATSMKKLIGLSLGMCLLSACSGLVLAQMNEDGTAPPPKVLVIQREFVKPGKAGAIHEKSESAFVRAMSAAKWPQHYFGMTSLSGPSRALFFVPYDSFAAWEKDNRDTEHNATLSAAFDHAQMADGDLLSAYDSSVWTYNEEQSLNGPVKIAEMRYMELTVFKVRPGHRHDWSELVKLYKDGYAKVPSAHWATFESMYGMSNGGEYLVAIPRKSLVEVDQDMTDQKQFADALGENGMKKLSELTAACVESEQSNLFQFNPRMSYAPDAWVKADPGFWKPKIAAPAKKEAAKPQQ
jgi:hypothetical protein